MCPHSSALLRNYNEPRDHSPRGGRAWLTCAITSPVLPRQAPGFFAQAHDGLVQGCSEFGQCYHAPFLNSTTGTVRARILRSCAADAVRR
jgi:hypothetical protein